MKRAGQSLFTNQKTEPHNGLFPYRADMYPPEFYCEAFTPGGVLREDWQGIISALTWAGPGMLNDRQNRVKRMRYEDGATFNPFDDPNDRKVPWALDIIPFILRQQEWEIIESGLIQRAFLIEKILADVYGPQNLMKNGLMPAEMIFANPRFMRPCHNIVPSGNNYLAYYAVDLYRHKDGSFRVLKDYASSPSGLGYALENRLVMSRVFSNIYHQKQILRLAPFFQTFHNSMAGGEPLTKEDPPIVILSSGPESRIYFEQALLSRYLNYPLVEGQDLTVRNGDVFLKKLTGLEQVQTIFRFVGDDSIDPFALRSGTATGVAGLLQVAREKRIDIVNPIGAGFIETPALSALLPGLSQNITGEPLKLANHPSWWCGMDDSRQFVLSNLSNLSIGPALAKSSPRLSEEELKQAITDTPYAFLAKEDIMASTVPVWDRKSGSAGYTVMRFFVCKSREGFSVMPGGLAMVSKDIYTLTYGSPDEQKSKDIWVLSDHPVKPFSLLSSLKTPAEFRRSSDLPSRVADHLLWLGRYMERAEERVRLVRAVFRKISGESRLAQMPELPFLLSLLRSQEILPKPLKGNAPLPRFRDLWQMLNNAVYEKNFSGSISSVLGQVQNSARSVRDWFSLDSWRAIDQLKDMTDTTSDDPLELLDNILFALNAFSGLSMESMTRGLGWRFMDMGRRIERAIHIAGLIKKGLPLLLDESRSTLEALLEVTASIMTYRARYRTTFQLAPVLDLLLIDESNPKSLAFQCAHLSDHVAHLPRKNERKFSTEEERMALELLTSVRLLDISGPENIQMSAPDSPLAVFLERTEQTLLNFSQVISAHYLARVPQTSHYTSLSDESAP